MRQPTTFPDRAQRLAGIFAGLNMRDNFPLLKSARLGDTWLENLRAAVDAYLLTTLEAYFPERQFGDTSDVFGDNLAEIQKLPNITPNGLILPKLETYRTYNAFHSVVTAIFDEVGLARHIEGVQTPINLRLVDGTPDAAIDSRARASVKMHSDMWAGEPANAIMVFLPIYDAGGKIGIKWIEPKAFPTDFMRPLDDFNEGRHLIEGGSEYDAGFHPGDLVMADPFLIHATQKNAEGARLSIDFRFTASAKLESDAPAAGTRQDSYFSYQDWAEIGRTRLLTTEARLEPFTGEDEPTKNTYAADFNIVGIDD